MLENISYQIKPSDQTDDTFSVVVPQQLDEREADGDRQGARSVEHRATFDAVLLVVLQQGADQSLLRRRVDADVSYRSRSERTLITMLKTFKN